MRSLALIIILVLLLLPASVSVRATDTPTPTPSLSPTPTLSNSERIAIGTIAPPRTCGTAFVPCGPLPFRPPRFPTIALPSPTLIDLSAYQPTTTPDTLTTPTPGMTATIADISSVGTLSYSAGVIGATLSAQRTLVLVLEGGTPIGIPQLMEGLGSNIAQPFAFLRGVQENYANLGIVSNFLTFGFYALIFIVFIRMAIIGIPFVVWLIRIIMEIIRTIKQ